MFVSRVGSPRCDCCRLYWFLPFESAGQIADELFVDERVNVLAEEKENKPVPNLALAGDQFDFVARRQTGLGPQQVHPCLGSQDDSQAVQQRQTGHYRQQDEPEPEEHVNLLVDDVQREDAQAVDFLNCTGRTKFVERAFGHLGEYLRGNNEHDN